MQNKFNGFQREMNAVNTLLEKAELTPIKIKSYEEYLKD